MTAHAIAPSSTNTLKVQRVMASCGVEAWLVEEHALPMIAFEFTFENGSTRDPAGLGGTAYLVSGLIDEGAGDLDSEAFQARLADQAIDLSFSARSDAFSGSMRCLTRHKAEAFALLALALNEPRFDADAVARVKGQVISGLKRAAQNPDSICSDAFFAAAFPSHTYGRPVKGTEASVSAVDTAALRAVSRGLFQRAGLKVVVVGDITADELAKELDAVFGALPMGTARDAITAPMAVSGLGQTHVIEMDVPQTVLRFGAPGLLRNDPDFITATVVNHMLGGSAFTSRLFMEVREKRGLAYGVSSSLFPLREAALHFGGTATKNDRAAESMDVIRAEMAKLAEEGPGEDEISEAKRYLIGSYPLRFDTSPKIAGELMGLATNDLPPEFVGERNSLFAAVTRDEAHRVAQRLYGSGKMLVQAVGKPEGLK
ncbi:MAG: M16 family metallopeptidase [Bosea sp. (in: a-proteobacteria)]